MTDVSSDAHVAEHVIPALMRENFDFFLRYAFAEVGGGREYLHNWHVDAIIHQLDRVRENETRRLIVNMPPRHLKSITITVAWVAWMLGNDPKLRFMCVSYGMDLAEDHALSCLKIIQSDWYRRAFPKLRLTRQAVMNFKTTMGGGRLSTSLAGASTGFGADYVIVDDPMKANEATSEANRIATKDTFDRSLRSRLENQDRGSFIIVAQRLHEDDLPGALIRSGNWDVLKLSAIATHDERIPLTRGRMHYRREGFALHPTRLSLTELEQLRDEEPFVFESQWQNDPVPRVGAFIQLDWFGTYDEPPRAGQVIMSCDTAVKIGVRNDWSVAIVARHYQGRFYILYVLRKRMTFQELERSIGDLCRTHNVERLLIEDASSGSSLIQNIWENQAPGVPMPIPVRAMLDKITRFEAQAGKIEAGQIVLPRAAPWLAEFMSELSKFPNGRHDDQADALAQMLANPPLEIPQNAAPELVDAYDTRLPPEIDFDPWAAH